MTSHNYDGRCRCPRPVEAEAILSDVLTNHREGLVPHRLSIALAAWARLRVMRGDYDEAVRVSEELLSLADQNEAEVRRGAAESMYHCHVWIRAPGKHGAVLTKPVLDCIG